MRRPAGITLIAVLAAVFALAGFAHAVVHVQGSGGVPASLPLAAAALGYGVSALATAVGVWKERGWAWYAFLAWMAFVLAVLVGQQAVQDLYDSWWRLGAVVALGWAPLTLAGAWYIRRHTTPDVPGFLLGGGTLAAGFLLGATATCGVFALSARLPPATPELRPPTAITVTLHPWEGVGGTGCEPVDVPPEKMDLVFRLLTPDQHFRGGVHDFITPIVAEAVITHADGTQTSVMVRDHGHNPAVVSVDGRNYFYARNDPDVHAGGTQLVRLVREVAHTKRTEHQPKP